MPLLVVCQACKSVLRPTAELGPPRCPSCNHGLRPDDWGQSSDEFFSRQSQLREALRLVPLTDPDVIGISEWLSLEPPAPGPAGADAPDAPQSSTCHRCGKQNLEPDARYCSRCGELFVPSGTASHTYSPQADVDSAPAPTRTSARPASPFPIYAKRARKWGNWALGLGAVSLVLGGWLGLIPIATAIVSLYAINEQSKWDAVHWQPVVGLLLSIGGFLVYLSAFGYL